jgi:hypothetical protein
MKKSFFIIVLFVTCSLSISSEPNWGGYFVNTNPVCVQLYYDDEGRPVEHRATEILPVLGYSGNTFVLATSYELENVTIVIRDEDGSILYYDVVSSITDYYMFQLSDDVIADMFSIELYYGDCHLYGEF